MSDRIKVIPCSGMGKVYSLVARESALKVVRELCQKESSTVCLAYILTGDQEAKDLIKGEKCITLDGCPSMCAAKYAELAGVVVTEKVRVIDSVRKHKGAKLGTDTELTEEGWLIVDEIAGEIAKTVQLLSREG